MLLREVNYLTIVDRIEHLCKENGISIYKLEKDLNMASNTIRKWDTASPSSKGLLQVADYFQVSTDFLLGRTENKYSHMDFTSGKESCIMRELIRLNISDTDVKVIVKVIDDIVTGYR